MNRTVEQLEAVEMKTMQVTIGDSTRGYTHATVSKASTGRYTLVAGSVEGIASLARSAVRGLNEDDVNPSALTSAGDSLPVRISEARRG